MHLIPDTWPHFHLLVSVFPAVCLIFAIGRFIGAMVANNTQMQRVGLFVFGGLAVLGVPTMFSGIWSESAMNRPGIPEGEGGSHLLWAYFALAFLGVTGVLALWVLWRAYKTGVGPSRNMQHLVLGLSLFTLLNMMVVGDMGWKISHQELKVPFVYGNTSQVWSHIHIILNHFPTVGFVIGLFFFICGLAMKNVVMERGALVVFVACAVLGATTYVTGASAMWALTSPPIPAPLGPISQARINAHRDFALLTLFGLGFTGGAAWIELYRYRYQAKFSKTALYVVLVLAVITFLIMAETGHRGGLINHPEIRTGADAAMTQDAATFLSPKI